MTQTNPHRPAGRPRRTRKGNHVTFLKLYIDITPYTFRQSAGRRCILYPLAYMFIPTPTRLLWEALNHYAITVRRPFTHMSTANYSRILVYTAEWTGMSRREWKWSSLEMEARGIHIRSPSIEDPQFYGVHTCVCVWVCLRVGVNATYYIIRGANRMICPHLKLSRLQCTIIMWSIAEMKKPDTQ